MYRHLLTVLIIAGFTAATHAAEPGEHFIKVPDIAYLGDAAETEYARTQCRLDVYYPKGKEDYPTIVWFHGGGLKGGSRRSGEVAARRFTAEGIGVVLVGYRLSPKVKCPAYIEDAAAAVAWTINNIGKYKGDPDKVFISGHSAGGYLTAMVGLDKSYLAKHEVSTARIAGLMPISGQMVTHSTVRGERGIPQTTPVIDRFAPSYHAAADGPPCLCIVGDQDLPARTEENIYCVAALKAAGHKHVQCRVFKGRNHGSIVASFPRADDEVAKAMLAFMRDVLGQ